MEATAAEDAFGEVIGAVASVGEEGAGAFELGVDSSSSCAYRNTKDGESGPLCNSEDLGEEEEGEDGELGERTFEFETMGPMGLEVGSEEL